jgi:non-heme chloroperoxidase
VAICSTFVWKKPFSAYSWRAAAITAPVSHGWLLSADDWDAQMLFFLHCAYRVIAHDRRGHGRSAQVSEGNDMNHYADDLADLVQHLDLHDAIHIGHPAGGGEVARYLGRHGESRVGG